ncbi:hypothetical protein FSP39_014519 [Pinctada imbricata]|uniref:Uncharacterized protein n=1 Tax=Pinctada imbricata TaxID=66713 RepID=A0AA88YJA6_PINIB|nr:hypothetical protein FSP39_014519 [Pinctada imbricata]
MSKSRRKNQVFTEGISSISKRPDPSFAISKDNVIRANLPNSVTVAQKKNQFTFGIRPSKVHKKYKELDDGVPKFKQIRMLGLDNLPAVDMSRYVSRQKMVQASIDYRNGVKGNYMKSPRRLDPIKGDNQRSYSRTGQSTARSLKSQMSGILSERTVISGLEHKVHVVSLGESLNNKFLEPPSRKKGLHPPIDIKQDGEENLRFYSKDPSVYGVCALAPIRVGPPVQNLDEILLRPSQSLKGSRKGTRKKSKAKSDTGPIRIPTQYPESTDPSSTEGKNEVRSDTIPSYQHEVLYRKRAPSPIESSSTHTTNPHIPNPPPSYSSSTDHAVDFVRNMTQIEEEKSTLERDRSSTEQKDCLVPDDSTTDQYEFRIAKIEPLPDIVFEKVKEEMPPVTYTSNSVARRRLSDGRHSRAKEAIVGNTLSLNLMESERRPSMGFVREGIHLSLPSVEMDVMSEKRPPMRDNRSEVSEYTVGRRNMDSQATWYSSKSDARESQKLSVRNLQLFDHITTKEDPSASNIRGSSEFSGPETSVFQTEVNSSQVDAEQLVRQSTEEEFKKFTVSSKSLQFISPLKVIENAKRQ